MEEKELIAKLRELRQIKPSQDWAVLVKDEILGQEQKAKQESPFAIILSTFRMIFAKPAYAGLAAFFVFAGLFGTFTFAQKSLPGEKLYSMKKVTERVQSAFVSEEELPLVQLELTNKRLEELAQVAQENRVKNLPSAINETRASISEANKNLAKASSPAEVKKIVDEIEEKAQTISQTLGVAFGEEELEELKQSSDKLYAEDLISALEASTLTEGQEEVLSQMKQLIEEEKYSGALILFQNEFNKPPTTTETIEESLEEIQTEETVEDVEEEEGTTEEEAEEELEDLEEKEGETSEEK
ncbi:hypothetical protein AMJ48_01235 [Parcubacteria bacterium DG_74_1]|nr:MAG: hypothetical protein AMJ48_01235 [Parcubacteria bacterium DG_74_1]